MKTIHLYVVAFFTPLLASTIEWTDELRAIESQQVELWRSTLESVKDKTPPEQIASLWLGLRNMGYRRENYDGHSVEVAQIYKEIQSTLLSIPGHARYFSDEIKREQKEVAQYPTVTGPRGTYDFNRGHYFLTLRHLPSPETIAVLGDFLSDDIDTPMPLNSPDSDWGENPRANSYFSADAIHKIGLRNPPVSPTVTALFPEDLLALTRAWWDEIKSGRKTFSFVGQDIEYRFKPDGTWETMPIGKPPDNDRPLKRPDAIRPDSSVSPAMHSGWWIGIGGFVLLALFAWLWRRKSTR